MPVPTSVLTIPTRMNFQNVLSNNFRINAFMAVPFTGRRLDVGGLLMLSESIIYRKAVGVSGCKAIL